MEEKWNPGHSTNKGYPYNEVMSKKMFANRPVIACNEDNKPTMNWSSGHYPDAPEWTEAEIHNPAIGFVMARLVDFHAALEIAEDQIETLLEEKPFIPEEFGFEVAYRPKTIHDDPLRVYINKFDTKISLYRKSQEIDSQSFDPAAWVILQKIDEDEFMDPLHVKLPCHRIAYALFYALGIPVEDKEAKKPVLIIEEIQSPQKIQKGYDIFDVVYNGKPSENHPVGIQIQMKCVGVDTKDAVTRAKFLIETTPEYKVDLVEFDDIQASRCVDVVI